MPPWGLAAAGAVNQPGCRVYSANAATTATAMLTTKRIVERRRGPKPLSSGPQSSGGGWALMTPTLPGAGFQPTASSSRLSAAADSVLTATADSASAGTADSASAGTAANPVTAHRCSMS